MVTNAAPKEPTVLLKKQHGWAIITLNRPKALQALNTQMVQELTQYFSTLANDDDIHAIWLESNTPKAFCAGGDVRSIRQSVLDNTPDVGDAFFKAEYQLDLMLHHYKKPIVVWGEGYIMGGGMGMLMACPYRVLTPKSKLAMPEVSIGLFPDVGGSRFLKARDQMGLFLGMTGSTLTAADSQYIGWATHVCSIPKDVVLNELLQIDWSKNPSLSQHNQNNKTHPEITEVLNSVNEPLPAFVLAELAQIINQACQGEDFQQDYQGLCALSQHENQWLKTAGENISQGAASSAALTWLLWQWAKDKTWEQVFTMEALLVMWKIRHPDFSEGVRARLVDKDLAPQWVYQPNQDAAKLCNILPELPAADDAQWQALLAQHDIKAV